jgi:hypothetical protein
MDPVAAARIVESLDRELAKRQSAKDKVQDAAWYADFAGDEVIILAKRLARHWDRHRAKPKTRPLVPPTPEDVECQNEETLETAKALFSLAEAVERDERHKEIEASGAPRRRPVVLGPQVRAAAPAGKERIVVDVMAKSDGAPAPHRRSRTEAYLEKQAAEAAARQQMLPPVPARPEQVEFWRRGVVLVFEQRSLLGVVKFAGLDGFSEAAVSPGVFMASGLTVLTPGMTVDCRLRRNADGSVVVVELRVASGADPSASAAEQAAAMSERFQIGINRNKWMN